MIPAKGQVMAADDDMLDSPISQTFSARFDQLACEEDGQLFAARNAKPSRRESRLGLRGIFGRSKPPKENESLPHTIHGPRTPAARMSLAGLSNWPRAHKSEGALLSGPSWQQLPVTPETPQEDLSAHDDPLSARKRKMRPRTPKQPREAPVHWSMPPLFKAFPQAVRHVTLPATSLSADAILRFSEKKAGTSSPQDPTAPVEDGELDPQETDRDRKKPRRNATVSAENLEWTTKIYILVTSGYLLQYAGDGHFDRLPEKVLRLGPSSAAFATDAIPGRHWVIHVSSTAQADGTPTPDSRSLFSKLPFRVDKRSTSNLLMVFEGADVMEAWISILRGEIEKLGGKKNLSETGKPKTAEATQHLREQPSQRTLIVRDLSRFGSNRLSRAVSGADRGDCGGETSPRLTNLDTPRDQSIDDVSTTNSSVSQDERQLDSLRESSQRLSYISSGQRTFVTSAGSSPEPSPIRDSFYSHAEEHSTHANEHCEAVARLRPNASDISIRRQSMQVTNPFVAPSLVLHGSTRSPLGSNGAVSRGDGLISPVGGRPTPNFSVPHSSNRRFSYARTYLTDVDDPPSEAPGGAQLRSARPGPPTALRESRPLSMVMDQPSPREVPPERPTTSQRPHKLLSPAKRPSQQRLRSISRGREGPDVEVALGRRSDFANMVEDRRGSAAEGHRRVSEFSVRRTEDASVPRTSQVLPLSRYDEPFARPQSPPRANPSDDARKYRSSFLDVGGPRSRSVEPSRAAKRASLNSIISDRSYDYHQSLMAELPQVPPPKGPLPPIPPPTDKECMANGLKPRASAFSRRRSLPQLAGGPPPAPPPTRALPPIPQNVQMRT
ncbi:hypothetical protein JDV02_007702 [Purpureocillium takamizusanense]|uniref:Peptidase family M20/M25/M40 protein n=1 Tax=Purpureocillium takamizusanense TaxID=2060973 RepID=A0A9Q8QNM9_9HYPO|nr:uncharacterized protein JDV02_007702 [Purpureocillium takamizusanense]UNI21742.1 hypothetical protein JDV02_007702 [Purpureocillium takamizusanense]